MRSRRAGSIVVCVLVVAAAGACGPSLGPGVGADVPTETATQPDAVLADAAPDAPGVTDAATAPPISFATHVQPVLDRHCLRCHSNENNGARLDAAHAYQALTTRSSSFCGLPRVTPGRPDQSALWIKLTEDITAEPLTLRCGREMPATGMGALAFTHPEEAEIIRAWIEQGAAP